MGVHAAEELGLDATRLRPVGAGAVQAVGLVDAADVPVAEDARVAHEPDRAARRERPAAEAEEEELVAWPVVLDKEAVAVAHVAGEAEPERAAADALEAPRADARLVMHPLRHAVG